MDPVTMAAIGAGGALLARLIGEAIAAGDIDRAAKLKEQAIAEYGPEILPELERVEAQTIPESAVGNLRNDPEGRSGQLAALARLGEMAAPGVTVEDDAMMRRASDEAGGVAARAAGAGEQLAAARGLRSSGLSQALAATGAQAGAQRSADTAASMMADAQQRKLSALGRMAGLAGDVRGSDFAEASKSAEAIDSLNRFNANMTYDAQQARNRAAQQRFDSEMRLKGARNAARGDMASFYGQRAERNKQTAEDVGAAVQGAANTGSGFLEDEIKKKR